MTRHSTLLTVALTLALSSSEGRAEDVNGAAKAFAQAQEVMLAGDAARAADLYELADELAPSAPALRNAARARLTASHSAMAATHATELLRRYPADKESRTVAEAILSMLSPKLTQLDITCATSCKLQVDGKMASSNARERHALFTQPGARTVVAVFDTDRSTTKQITAIVGQTVVLRLEAPPKKVEPVVAPPAGPLDATVQPIRQPPPKVIRRGGISRMWVLSGTIVTVGLGVTAALSGMATLDTRDEIKKSVESGSQATAVDLYNKGRDQQIRTNVLFAATAATGITTVVLAFVTNWSGKRTSNEVVVAPTTGGLTVGYGGRF